MFLGGSLDRGRLFLAHLGRTHEFFHFLVFEAVLIFIDAVRGNSVVIFLDEDDSAIVVFGVAED